MASLLLGAVTVPLYTTLTADQTAFVLNDSGCRAIFLSSDQQLRKILSILPRQRSKKSSSWIPWNSSAISLRSRANASP